MTPAAHLVQAVMAGGKLWLATSTLVASDRSSPSYSRRPAVTWAELAVTPSTQGTDTCAQSRAGAASRQSWDAAKDYSLEWGAQVRLIELAPACVVARWSKANQPTPT
jgi:hypothetical protein